MTNLILLGHIGPTLWAGQKLAPQKYFDYKIILLVIFWSVFPDLIDKSLMTLGLASANTGRLWAHTLLASLAVCLLCRFFIKSSWPWVLAMPGHLVLDTIWLEPRTMLWPFLGNTFDPITQPVDLAGLGYIELWKWMYIHEPLSLAFRITTEVAGLFFLYLFFKGRRQPEGLGYDRIKAKYHGEIEHPEQT